VFYQHHFQWPQLAVFLFQKVGAMSTVKQSWVTVAGGQQGQPWLNALAINGDGAQAVVIPF
jgi:hypothetical protein